MYREVIITHTAQADSEPKQTFKKLFFAKMLTYFCGKLHIRGGLYNGEFKPGLNFQLVKP